VTPANANSGRRAYFRQLIRSKLTVYSLVLGCLGAFVYGASQHDALIMAAGPLGVVLLVLVVVAYLADKRSARSFYLAFAEAAGLECVGNWEILPFTPLLGAGDRQHCENWMIGDVLKEPRLNGGLGHFVYEEIRESTDSNGVSRKRTVEKNRITVCFVDLEESILLFKGIFVRQRRGSLNLQRDWLANTPSRSVELESAALTRKYELRIGEDQDEILLRRLFSPTLVNWLAEHPLSPGFELRGGTLVVFVPKVLEDGGTLTYLLDATRAIALRVLGEVEEAAERVLPKTRPATVSSTPPPSSEPQTAGL
jgi:hypothetical protein